jgi:hypothetical protein
LPAKTAPGFRRQDVTFIHAVITQLRLRVSIAAT